MYCYSLLNEMAEQMIPPRVTQSCTHIHGTVCRGIPHWCANNHIGNGTLSSAMDECSLRRLVPGLCPHAPYHHLLQSCTLVLTLFSTLSFSTMQFADLYYQACLFIFFYIAICWFIGTKDYCLIGGNTMPHDFAGRWSGSFVAGLVIYLFFHASYYGAFFSTFWHLVL
jgi:hypothetical protein